MKWSESSRTVIGGCRGRLKVVPNETPAPMRFRRRSRINLRKLIQLAILVLIVIIILKLLKVL
jgi:hypothetical protein